MKSDEAPTAAEVLGRTCRALRGDHKTEALAQAVKAAGLPWTTGHVAHLESGKVSPTITTLFVLARAFSDLLQHPVTLADLLDGDQVALGSKDRGYRVIRLSEVRAALSGQAVKPPSGAETVAAAMRDYDAKMSTWPERLQSMDSRRHRRTASTWRETDERTVVSLEKDLGLEQSRIKAEMAYLWGQSLTAQRDEVAGPDANQQRRGRISRELIEHLRESMANGDD
jgi:hypothetical protein